MTGRISDKGLVTLFAALVAVVLMVRFPISFGNDGAADATEASPTTEIAEQWVRLDSLKSLVGRLCEVKHCSMETSASGPMIVLKVSGLYDKTDLLGRDWPRLVRQYRSSRRGIELAGDDIIFQCEPEELEGVEYVQIPLHVLHALAEIRRF